MQHLGLGRINQLGNAVHDKHAPLRYRWPGISAAQRRAPSQLRALLGESIENPVLLPHRIPSGPQPLRPIGSRKCPAQYQNK